MSKDYKQNLTFSQRIGLKPIDPPLQIDELNDELRSTLWNIFYNGFYSNYDSPNRAGDSKKYYNALKIIWFRFLKKPIDEIDDLYKYQITSMFKSIFLQGDWARIYEFYEYLLAENFGSISVDREQYQRTLNFHLNENLSGFRMIDFVFVPLTNSHEINEVESLNEKTKIEKLATINSHLKSSISLLSNKNNPDYRNSIKESISMIESIARIIYPEANTLGKALKRLKDQNILDSTLILGFEKLYGYSNGKDGIRHALLESSQNISREDAQYFLISCSAFTNYIIEKARINNLI